MEKKQFEIKAIELETMVKLLMVKNQFLTPARIYARWKCGKLKILQDYLLWEKDDFMKLFESKEDGKIKAN